MLRCVKDNRESATLFTFYCDKCQKHMSGIEALSHLKEHHKLNTYETVLAYKKARLTAQEAV